MKAFDASRYQLSDFKTVNFDADATLVTYVMKSSDPRAPLERHTTIWVKRDGKWRALFHQGTPEEKMAASSGTPSASKTPV